MNKKIKCVQYERLRPGQIVERRRKCPVAYLPLGTIEWHGEHNPVGLDTLKMHALLIKCAEKIGGLVFPPLYYGEDREQTLMEAVADDREALAGKMDLPASNFNPGYMGEPVMFQNRTYHALLVHILMEIKSLGFKVVVVGAGHYPLLDFARSAATFFHQTQKHPKMMVWAMSGYELLRGKTKIQPCGDHAGKWETSLLLSLDPGMQDLSLLPQDRGVKPIGATNNGAQDSSAAFGRKATDAIVQAVQIRVAGFLNHPASYLCPV